MQWGAIAGAFAALLLMWIALLLVLWRVKPDRDALREAMRLLPDVLRLVGRLARDPTVPAGVRLRLWLLLLYLAMPFDLVPDFIPVLGYADDAIVVIWTLRSVTRLAGGDVVERQWPGTPDGLSALTRLAGLSPRR